LEVIEKNDLGDDCPLPSKRLMCDRFQFSYATVLLLSFASAIKGFGHWNHRHLPAEQAAIRKLQQ